MTKLILVTHNNNNNNNTFPVNVCQQLKGKQREVITNTNGAYANKQQK
jgi:hypothetical protein